MIELHPRDYIMGFSGYLQARFGNLDLSLIPVSGAHSDVAIHGIYKIPRVVAEFSAEFFTEKDKRLKFLLDLMIARDSWFDFGKPHVNVHDRGLSRLLGDVREVVHDDEQNHHYTVSCRVRRDHSQINNMNIVYQDIVDYLIKTAFKSITPVKNSIL